MSQRGRVALHLVALLKNLLAGARVALFLPVRALDFRVSAAHYALLVAFNLAAWIAAAAARAGFEGRVDAAAIPVYLATVPLVLLTALAVAAAYRDPGRVLLFAVALSASDLLFEAAGLALPWIAARTGFAVPLYFAFFGWIWVAAVRVVAVCGDTRWPQFYQGAAAVGLMIAVALFVFPKTEAWKKPAPGDRPPALAVERAFHAQGELIERAIAAIPPGKRGVPEMYFVGFAPDGSQDVFLREMRFVRRLFDERYGTAGRSVVLANGDAALEEFPLATATNLARVLSRVGAAMNAGEDVLVLLISAHGDREHRLSAAQPPLVLAALTPTALARLLHDAGIDFRVVLVSACFSGGFVEPLRDANTLVATASAADRQSFGCEHGRDFTFFGQAFFRDALAKTRSFAAAFEEAKNIVARMEVDEKLAPSLPQIWIGAAIAERLKAFE